MKLHLIGVDSRGPRDWACCRLARSEGGNLVGS